MVIGVHVGVPARTEGIREAEGQAWFDRYVRDIANGIEAEPKVRLWLSDGDREDDLAGDFVRYDGSDWPVPDTHWESLTLAPGGRLTAAPPARAATDAYAQVPSLTTNSDPYNTAIAGSAGLNALT